MLLKYLGVFFSALTAISNAKTFNFNVVSILGEGYIMGVKYDTNEIPIPLTSTTFPLFKGSISVPTLTKYKYVALEPTTNKIIEEEKILRTYTEENSKVNEVYNRTTKLEINIPKLPEPFKPMFKMGSKNFKPFPNEIFNVYAKCNENDYFDVSNHPFNIIDGKKTGNNKLVNCTFNIVSPTTTFSSDGTLHVIGYGSRSYKKLSFGFKFDKKFLGRKAVKIRAMANDPTYVRERLSTELFRAVGVPAQEGAYARLFINGDIYGLYFLIDSISNRWIKSYIHGDIKAKIGVSYQLISSQPSGPYSDLRYKGENYEEYDANGPYALDEYEKSDFAPGDEASKWKPLIDFTRMYDNWIKTYGNDSSDKAIEELKKFLNIESTLRMMAIEALIVSLDNFWLVSSNTAIYYNPERKNYQFIPFDFDQTFLGSRDFIFIPKDYMNDCITWTNAAESVYEHYFVNNLLSHPQIKQRYEVILAKASREVFDSDTVSSYVHALADLIREDVEWSFNSIDYLNTEYKGYVNHYNIEEFEGNLEYLHVSFNQSIRAEDTVFGIREWVEKRGNGCRASTDSIDISNNENISDNVNIEPFVDSKSGSS
ncbi:coth-domain-containing protein, partial [Piromyces finnis]